MVELREIKALGVLLLLVGIGISAAHNPNISPEDTTEEDLNLSDADRCFKEKGEWFCYLPNANSGIKVKFTEDVECYSQKDINLSINNISGQFKFCYGRIESLEDVKIEEYLQKFSKDEVETLKRKKKLSKDEEIPVGIYPDQINYSKCEKAKLDDPLLKERLLNCSYKGETYTANVSSWKEGLIIFHMNKPEGLTIPNIPPTILIFLLLIIGAIAWILYPKIKKMKKGNKNE